MSRRHEAADNGEGVNRHWERLQNGVASADKTWPRRRRVPVWAWVLITVLVIVIARAI